MVYADDSEDDDVGEIDYRSHIPQPVQHIRASLLHKYKQSFETPGDKASYLTGDELGDFTESLFLRSSNNNTRLKEMNTVSDNYNSDTVEKNKSNYGQPDIKDYGNSSGVRGSLNTSRDMSTKQRSPVKNEVRKKSVVRQ